jgi:hypothetical protein
LNSAQFALKTLKNTSKCAVIEPFFNLLVRMDTDICRFSVRLHVDLSSKRNPSPIFVLLYAGKFPRFVAMQP